MFETLLSEMIRRSKQVAEKAVFALFLVIPAGAGIQYFLTFLHSRLRGSDERIVFFSNLLSRDVRRLGGRGI